MYAVYSSSCTGGDAGSVSFSDPTVVSELDSVADEDEEDGLIALGAFGAFLLINRRTCLSAYILPSYSEAGSLR